jgi:hypothetical protein
MTSGITMHIRQYLLLALFALTACDQLGFDDQAKALVAREAEGRAIGGGCRHSGRALEDCYQLNPKAMKAAVFAGWRDMDAYMRENKIEVVPPTDFRAKPFVFEEKPATDKSKESKPEARPPLEKAKDATAKPMTKS